MSKEAVLHYAAEFIAVRRGRARARSNLSKLRRKWIEATESLYDPSEREHLDEELVPLADAIDAALKEREACNKQYTKALYKLDGRFGKGLVWQSATGTVDLAAGSRSAVSETGTRNKRVQP